MSVLGFVVPVHALVPVPVRLLGSLCEPEHGCILVHQPVAFAHAAGAIVVVGVGVVVVVVVVAVDDGFGVAAVAGREAGDGAEERSDGGSGVLRFGSKSSM